MSMMPENLPARDAVGRAEPSITGAETADAETADEEMEDAVAGSPAIADHLGHCNSGK